MLYLSTYILRENFNDPIVGNGRFTNEHTFGFDFKKKYDKSVHFHI